jgi:hypothetical protein
MQFPYRERHTNLRVVRARRAGDVHRRHKQLVKPFLNNCLAIAARDTYDRNIKLVTMTLCKSLEGCEGGRNDKEISIFPFLIRRDRVGAANAEVPYTPAMQVFYIVMSIITL